MKKGVVKCDTCDGSASESLVSDAEIDRAKIFGNSLFGRLAQQIDRERLKALEWGEHARLSQKAARKIRDQRDDLERSRLMYSKAWWRELEGPYFHKTHDIDGLVLTTQARMKDLRNAREENDKLKEEIMELKANGKEA